MGGGGGRLSGASLLLGYRLLPGGSPLGTLGNSLPEQPRCTREQSEHFPPGTVSVQNQNRTTEPNNKEGNNKQQQQCYCSHPEKIASDFLGLDFI